MLINFQREGFRNAIGRYQYTRREDLLTLVRVDVADGLSWKEGYLAAPHSLRECSCGFFLRPGK